jgi:flavin-dependent dehydrogenase
VSAEEFDLAVLGAGPAGAVTALEAARLGLEVALFDPRPQDFDKPCGEGIMASGVDALLQLGLKDLCSAGNRFDSIRYCVPGREPLSVPLPRPGYSMSRPQLQQRLDGLLDAEPRIRRLAARAHVTRTAEGYSIESEAAGCLARTLAVADGASGSTAPWLRGKPHSSGRFGLRARFAARRALDHVEVHLAPCCEVYLTPLPGGLINVAVLFESTPSELHGAGPLLNHALAGLPELGEVLGELHTRPAARALGYHSPRRVAESGAFLVGDAGGGADPILGCGVTIAVRSGLFAARAAAQVLAGERSGAAERGYIEAYRHETRSRRAIARALRNAAPHPMLLRGLVGLGRRFPGMLQPLVRIVSGESSAA